MPEATHDPALYLKTLGQSGEGPFDIAEAALMLSAFDHPNRPLKPFHDHLAEVAHTAKAEMRIATRVEDAATALAAVIVSRFGYDGDRLSYENPLNADFMSVIERRRGLPVALGILYIHAARAAALEASGLNAPGHFLLRIAFSGREAILDPFNNGAIVDRERLSAPPAMAADIGDEAGAAEPVTDAEVLLRLANNQKLRALNAGDKIRALEMARRMVLIAPRRAESWMELARLNEAAGSLGAAKKAYEVCLALAMPGDGLHNDAVLGLSGLKRQIN